FYGIDWLCVALSQERGFRVRVADLIHADKTTPLHACVWIRCCDVASEPQLENFCGRCCWIGVSARSIVGIFPSRSELVLCSHGNTFQRSRVVAGSNPRATISSIDAFYGLGSLLRDSRSDSWSRHRLEGLDEAGIASGRRLQRAYLGPVQLVSWAGRNVSSVCPCDRPTPPTKFRRRV